MSHSYWLVDKRVLVVKLTEQAGGADDDQADYFLQLRNTVAQGTAPVYMVVDGQEVTKLFSPLTANRLGSNIQQLNQAQSTDGPVWTVIVSDNMAVRFVGSLVAQWSGGKMRAVSTLDDALDFLNSRDASLPQNLKRLISASTGK